ncbi:uncharacterized protein FA14DRAFT_46179 [Meira miltonrushii]|uniref:Metaxin glutathione S-transferase domain-containing protein n=1 Tax=Meira miltonrushii TaxID=1280837 RepID=A0A316VDU7_9BASI|nr:uncharacterized protein FA14DRAFT_46179 [Meira miltonrushii]PWN35726.1 hypothetical protein FA14DRAFT_46179 [Meira miltonrushii]
MDAVNHPPKRIRLIAWAVQEASAKSNLPILDPDGLYALSILQARRGAKVALGDVEVEVQAPSSLLHSSIPCLEDASTGVILADSLSATEAYSWKLAGKKAERSLLADRLLEEDTKKLARCKALERYVLSELHPIVHQILYAKDLYDRHTSRVYQSGLGHLSRYSMPNRIRRQLQVAFAEKGRYIDPSNELGPILRQYNTQRDLVLEDRREREEIAQRAGIGMSGGSAIKRKSGAGLLREEKEKASIAFKQSKMTTFAQEVFNTLAESLGEEEYFSSLAKPSVLDLRIFSLLAPLLLPAHEYPALAEAPIAQALRSSYPTLLQHSERIRLLLWSKQEASPQSEAPDWPILPGRQRNATAANDEPLSIRIATQLGRSTSQAYMFARRMTSNLMPFSRSRAVASNQRPRSAAEAREARIMTIGRYVWIASAIVGVIGTAFASGLLRIEIVDESEAEPVAENEEGWQTVTGEEVDEELEDGEIDLDDEDDEEDDDDDVEDELELDDELDLDEED